MVGNEMEEEIDDYTEPLLFLPIGEKNLCESYENDYSHLSS